MIVPTDVYLGESEAILCISLCHFSAFIASLVLLIGGCVFRSLFYNSAGERTGGSGLATLCPSDGFDWIVVHGDQGATFANR